MAFTFISSTTGNASGTSPALNVASGDLLVAFFSWEDNGNNYPSLSDGGSNSFTLSSVINNTNNNNWARIGYKINATANSNAVFTPGTPPDITFYFAVFQFRPDSGATVSLDVSPSGVQSSGTSFASSSFSTTGTDEVIVCGMKNYEWYTFTSPAIDGDAVDGTVNSSFCSIGYWIKTTTVSSKTVTATVANSTWVGMVVGFKSEAAASTTIPVLMNQYRQRRN